MSGYRKMRNHQTALQALGYFTDCQIATLEGFLLKSKPPKGETQRHARIALKMLDTCSQYGLDGDCLAVLMERWQLSLKEYENKIGAFSL